MSGILWLVCIKVMVGEHGGDEEEVEVCSDNVGLEVIMVHHQG